MAATKTKKEKSSGFGVMTNPAIRRLQQKMEAERTSVTATYAGVTQKTVYFLIWTVIGIVAYFILQGNLLNMAADTYTVVEAEGVFEFGMTAASGLAVIIAAVVTIVSAIICIFSGAAIPIVGTIYCIAEGYLLSFITDALAPQYEWLGMLALILTVAIVAVLLFLYSSGRIQVGHKFRAVMFTLCIVIICISIFVLVVTFVPLFRPAAYALNAIVSNPVVSIGLSALFVVFACLFLVSDFDAAKQLVESGMPKKYEWGCAFGIAYTILYLYIKILELLINIFGRSSSHD